MAQPQRQADVHQDELCPPNKRYALMDANKKIDLENLLTIFHLPRATDNNHDHFVPAPKFSEMVPVYINNLGFTLELRSPSNFKTTSLIMQMLCCFVNNIHVDYADLLWEGLHYSLEHPSTLIPYPRFIKLRVSHYMTAFPEISRRFHDKYHNLEDDEMVKSIFNSGTNKARVGMKIPSWMITDEMKLTEHYRMYAAVFEVYVPTTHLVEQKSRDELEAKKNVQQVKEHLIAEEIEKLVEGIENVDNAEVDSSTLRQNDNQNDPGTRLEPRNNKESPEVKITAAVQLVNVNEEEEKSAEDDYELRRREKGKYVKESTLRQNEELTVNDPPPSSSTPSSSSQKPKLSASRHILSLFKPKTVHFKRYKSSFDELQGRYGYLFEHLKTRFMPRKKFHELARYLQEVMEESLPKMDDLPIWLALKYKFERLHVSDTSCRHFAVRPRDQEDPYDDAHSEGESSAKRQKTSKHGTYVFGESSSGQDNGSELGPSTSGNQEQLDDFDFWMDSYATDDDELPTEIVSQELVEEMSQTVDEAKLRKVPTLVIQSCQRDPKAPALSRVNQDLLYLKKGNSRPEKIVMSLHKFPVVIFPNDDIEERTSRWIDKYYKNLNKNDIEDLYLLIVNSKVDDYAETGLLLLLYVFIRSIVIWERVHDFQLGIEKYKMFSIIFEPLYGIIYKNNKKEKRVMRHQDVYKFCDATLKRVLEELKSYNNNVKHGYVTPSLSKEDSEYLQLYEE
ncbi:hypothetical protein Tco_1050623 [Tanacetum coccineum]